MHGFGVDVSSPEPPFVLLQVLYRQLIRPFSFLSSSSSDDEYSSSSSSNSDTGRDIIYPLYALLKACVRAVVWVVGYLVGVLVGDGGAADTPVRRDERASRPWWGSDLGLGDDEVL